MPPISSQSPSDNNQLISSEITVFLIDRQASHKSENTLKFYEGELNRFVKYLETIDVRKMQDLQPTHVRQYLIELSTHRNPGGVHAGYRSIRAFILWYALEMDDPYFERFMKKITAPKVNNQPIQGITLDQLRDLLATCDRNFYGLRDRAIMVTLIDTGLRAAEFVKLNFNDIDFKTGAIQVRAGKGEKNRIVFVNAVARKEILRYLRLYPNPKPNSPLWLNSSGKRLQYFGLREMLRRRAEKSGIIEQSAHDFRRGFTVESLRNGCDLASLMRLMGHSDIKTTQRYIKLLDDDLRKAHESSSPADNL